MATHVLFLPIHPSAGEVFADAVAVLSSDEDRVDVKESSVPSNVGEELKSHGMANGKAISENPLHSNNASY